MISVSTLAGLTINGLVAASTLFIIASGLSIIFGVTRIVNFAHGSLYMLGAYIAYSLIERLPQTLSGFALAVGGSCLAVAAIGFVIEIGLLRRLYQAPLLYQLLATYGLVLIVQDVVRTVWGPEDLVDAWGPGISEGVPIAGNYVPAYSLALIAVGPCLYGLLWLLQHRTRWGMLIRAATEDREMLSSLGVNQRWLFTSVFCLGAALAAFGGALAVPRGGASTQLDLSVIVDAFVVVVVGGMGSLSGALLAAILIGLIQSFGLLFLPKFTLVLVFLIMAVVLVIRPQGLAGRREGPVRQANAIGEEEQSRSWLKHVTALQCGLFVLIGVSPLVFGQGGAVVATDLLILMIFAASLYLIVAVGGILSFGHAAFFGAGAYGAAMLSKYFGWPMLGALAAAPVVGAVFAGIFGRFCIRMDGIYRAMLTLAFAQILWSIAFQWQSVTGGDSGLLGIRPSDWASSRVGFLYLVLPIAAAVILLLTRVSKSPFGYALRGTRDAPKRAAAIGANVEQVQWAAFTIAGAVAGLAGGLYAFARGSVFPDTISIDFSVEGLVLLVVGGLNTWFGPLIGTVVYHGILTELIKVTEFWRTFAGLFIIVLSVAKSTDLSGLLRLATRRTAAVPA